MTRRRIIVEASLFSTEPERLGMVRDNEVSLLFPELKARHTGNNKYGLTV
jgi:hypothetical protein